MTNWQQPFPDDNLGDAFGVVTPLRKKLGLGPHRGCDWNGFRAGTPLKAVADGKIVRSYWSNGLGWVVVLQVIAPWKDNPKRKLFFGYCHMQDQGLKVGSEVTCGDVIGFAGNTGTFTSGTHLHLTLGLVPESVSMGFVTDPHAYIERRIAQLPKPKTTPSKKRASK